MKPIATSHDPEVWEFVKALGIDDTARVRRVIIDIKYNDVVTVYVEQIADKKAFEIGADIFAGIDVHITDVK